MDFQIVTSVPFDLNSGAIERAVSSFVDDTKSAKIPRDDEGFYKQLVTYIGSCLISKSNPNSQVWLAIDEDKEVAAFALSNFVIHVDNKLTLWLSAAWVRPKHRFTKEVKAWFHQLEDFGKASGAKHLLIPSVRGEKGYLRFVGKDWHKYEVILKKDL